MNTGKRLATNRIFDIYEDPKDLDNVIFVAKGSKNGEIVKKVSFLSRSFGSFKKFDGLPVTLIGVIDRTNPIDLSKISGLSISKKKPTDTSAKGMTGGIVLFKGVPKPKKKPPTVTSTDINNLAVRVRQHNAKAKPAQRANLRDLKNVYLRGLEDGDKSSANKRISKFLSLLMSDKPKDVKYFDDNDLLPLDHPWRNRKTTKKWAGFDDGEYGVKYAEKCCPQVVKRYHAK